MSRTLVLPGRNLKYDWKDKVDTYFFPLKELCRIFLTLKLYIFSQQILRNKFAVTFIMCCILTFHWTLFQSLAHTVKGFHKEGLTYISNLFHVKHCKYNLKGRASCLNQPASRSHFYGGPQRTCHIFFYLVANQNIAQ